LEEISTAKGNRNKEHDKPI